MAVGAIARDLPISRPAVSQHLKVLKTARLVTDAADGNRRLYRLDPSGFESLRRYFDSFCTRALDAFASRMEEER